MKPLGGEGGNLQTRRNIQLIFIQQGMNIFILKYLYKLYSYFLYILFDNILCGTEGKK